jgi:hypothetical protein
MLVAFWTHSRDRDRTGGKACEEDDGKKKEEEDGRFPKSYITTSIAISAAASAPTPMATIAAAAAAASPAAAAAVALPPPPPPRPLRPAGQEERGFHDRRRRRCHCPKCTSAAAAAIGAVSDFVSVGLHERDDKTRAISKVERGQKL